MLRAVKASLAVIVSAALAAPASAQVRAAASVLAAGQVRVAPVMPALLGARAPLSAPGALAHALSPALAAPAALPLPAASAAASASAAEAAAAPAADVAPASSVAAPAAEAAALPAPAAAASAHSAAPALAAAARTPAAARGTWERFWSGAAERPAAAVSAAASAAEQPSGAAPLAAARGRRRLAALAAVPLPAVILTGLHSLVVRAAPYAEGLAILAGAYALSRVVGKVIEKVATRKSVDRQWITAARLVSSVALWTGGVVAALKFGGASPSIMTAVYGGGGTILTLGLKDVLGNLIQGVTFLATRPFTIGDRVKIGTATGTVKNLDLNVVTLAAEDGAEIKIRYATIADKPVIVFGPYRPTEKRLQLLASKPKFHGLAGAVASSLDARFWIASAAVAALLLAPGAIAALSAGWAAALVHYALAAAAVYLTRRVERVLVSVVGKLAAKNGWSLETRVTTLLLARALAWTLGGSAVLRVLGVSWTMLAASLGLTTLGIGLAANNYFGAVVQGALVLFTKPFKIGDRIAIDDFAPGAVVDMTRFHVVLKLDDERHALVPYSVVRDGVVVVTPPTTQK